jgi:hypothetical protein
MGVVGFSGQAGRYLSGLCVATLGLCAAGWLALAAAGFGGFFTALVGRIRELYAQAGAAQEPGGAPE